MKESDAVSLQADASVGIGTGCAVFQVSLDGAAYVGELAAYLVMPSGEEFHFQKMVAVGVANVTVAQFGELRFGPGLACDETLVQFLVALHPVFQQTFLLFRSGTA